MHMAMDEPELEPCDLFVDMGMLIIEGRTPLATPTTMTTTGGGVDQRRCYGEGPHAPRMWDCGVPAASSSSSPSSSSSSSSLATSQQPGSTTVQQRTAAHVCNQQNAQCAQLEGFRKHMLLLWKNNIPMSIEVLLCPDCCHGADRPSEAAAGPEPTFVLLEQWTVHMMPRRFLELSIVPRVLMQAVRSYLHFSQLSAWYSQTGGREPKNVVYRVCVPGEVFSNKFGKPPDEHVFPMSNVGWSNILKVSVKTMPRTESVPRVICPLHGTGHPNAVGCTTKLQGPNAKARSPHGDSTKSPDRDFRRHLTCLDGPVSMQSSSPGAADCMLGDSLLDPPQDLEMYPKRYQSPSRSGSPVMETPEHWLFGGHGLRGRPPPPRLDLALDGRRPRERGRPWRKTTTSPDQLERDIDEARKTKIPVGKGRLERCSRDEVDCYVSEILRDRDSSKRFLSHLKRRPFSRLAAKFQNVNYDEDIDLPSSSSSDLDSIIRRAKMAEARNRQTPPSPDAPSLQKDAKSFVWVKGRLPISPLVRDALARGELKKAAAETRGDAPTSLATATDSVPRRDDDDHSEGDRWSKICDDSRSSQFSDSSPVSAITANDRQSPSSSPVERKGFSSEDEEFNGNSCLHVRKEVPSAVDKAKFRRSLDSAAYLVFHARTGLPLTSSPAPVRRGNSFDFDSSLTSVSAIKHALFDKDVCTVAEEEEEEERVRLQLSTSAPASLANNSNLLGNFEESVLNGRLEPVSTVEGFTAEIGASGSFCPRHIVRPVTVFFYTLSDVDKVSTPYLGHINLGKKGYLVPKNGTIQVTLFNPHGTVVKMFVVMYDLHDMPVRCQTFLRQRTLYMPVDASDDDADARKWLRYLIHLRFASSKSGRIYLHTDIRMVIFRKSDMDVANIHGKVTYELRSFTKGPTMPRFSPRR